MSGLAENGNPSMKLPDQGIYPSTTFVRNGLLEATRRHSTGGNATRIHLLHHSENGQGSMSDVNPSGRKVVVKAAVNHEWKVVF